ncbi:hypothetical protein D5Z92_14625 [Listeria monocytogenes]|nr:hypothetical protein [Listeria monocytogenes]EAH3791826.1 hypothetical protein [Listeria monocytogenes]
MDKKYAKSRKTKQLLLALATVIGFINIIQYVFVILFWMTSEASGNYNAAQGLLVITILTTLILLLHIRNYRNFEKVAPKIYTYILAVIVGLLSCLLVIAIPFIIGEFVLIVLCLLTIQQYKKQIKLELESNEIE